MDSYEVRLYDDADFAGVALLEESGLHEPYRSAVFVRQMGEVCRETFLVAINEKRETVGYTVGSRVQHDFREAWILRLGVREDQRRKGIGAALLKAVLAALHTRHSCTVRLTVSLKNQPAIHLYEGQGFGQEKIVHDYFGRGEDRIIMKKVLDKGNFLLC